MDRSKRPYFDHLVIELYGVAEVNAQSVEWIDEQVRKLLGKFGIVVIDANAHDFSPGVSIVYILSASHMAVHSWPEKRYLHLDLVSCSKDADFNQLNGLLKEIFPAVQAKVSVFKY